MNLYAVSVSFVRIEFPGDLMRVFHKAYAALAKNETDACAAALEEYKRLYPESEGWFGHTAISVSVHTALIHRALGYYYDAPLDILGLPELAFNKLYKNHIRTVGDALKLISRGVDAYPTMTAVGDKTLAAVRKALETLGYIASYD